MKTKIEQYDKLTAEVEKVNKKYEKKRKEIDSTDRVNKLKTALTNLKLEVFKIDQRSGIIQTILPKKEEQEKKLHHLYDDIDYDDDDFLEDS